MLDTFNKIKPAIDFGAGEEISTVVVKDGMMYGTNGHMTAGAPFAFDGEFTVNATLLQRALALTPDPDLKLTDKSLMLTKGKARSRLGLIEKESAYQVPDHTLMKMAVTDGFTDACRVLLPFIGESHIYLWRCGIAFTEGAAWAANGSSMCRYEYNAFGEFLLNVRAVEYVLKRREKVTHYALHSQYVTLYFADGSWLRMQRTPEEKLERIPSIFEQRYQSPNQEISSELRAALEQAFLAKSDAITISADGVFAEIMNGQVNVEAAVGSDAETSWTRDVLETVIQYATHLLVVTDVVSGNVMPSSFSGPNIQGLIIRREKACERQ